MTDPAATADLDGRVDLVLCNPPYVPEGSPVPPEVAEHDPVVAVFAGPDGLAVIRPVIARAAALLRPGGALGIEHDDTHGAAVPALLKATGSYTGVTRHQDLTGPAPLHHGHPPHPHPHPTPHPPPRAGSILEAWCPE